MYNAQNAQKTVVELRNAMSILRSTPKEEVNYDLLELILGHGIVDLSISIELIDQLAKENGALKKQIDALKTTSEDTAS